MSNAHFKEKEMSLKAKGLLSLMLSLPDTWDYSIAGLCAICKENQSAIKSTLSELKHFGYLVVTKKMPNETESGRIEYTYNIYEKPQKQTTEKQGIENLPLENQGVENPIQLNTNKSNTKKVNTKKSNTKDIYITEFEELWSLYPNKKGKDKALTAYIKARKAGESYETIKQGILDYSEECKLKKREKQYIKHGSTWFNNSGWKDEYDLSTGGSNNGAANSDNGKAEQPIWSGDWF